MELLYLGAARKGIYREGRERRGLKKKKMKSPKRVCHRCQGKGDYQET